MTNARALLAIMLTACGPSPGPVTMTMPVTAPAPAALLPSADLEADLAILEREYRALHPGLNRYNTPAEIDALFADARRAFARDRALGEAFVELTRLTAAIRCGHSYPNPSNQPDAIAAALFDRPRLPWLFTRRDGRMLVTRSFTPALTAGMLVDKLDGVATRDLLAKLLPLARADGHNDAKRAAYLSVTGESTHEAFDVLAPLVEPTLFAGPDVQVAVGDHVMDVPLQSRAEREAATHTPTPADDAPLWTR